MSITGLRIADLWGECWPLLCEESVGLYQANSMNASRSHAFSQVRPFQTHARSAPERSSGQ